VIGYLKGQLLQKQPPFLMLDVNGVGYELEAPMSTFYQLPGVKETVSLFVHLVVREDAQLLYGFSDQPQRELFRSLLKINGVGPRVGLAILSTLSTVEFVTCIHHEDVLTLIRVPGIGKKTAERMILDMRDRIDSLAGADTLPGAAAGVEQEQNPLQDAIGALIALGYKPVDASRAVESVKNSSEHRDDLIRNALQFLSKR
jgi:Holliday junction DNA helicase RuvA